MTKQEKIMLQVLNDSVEIYGRNNRPFSLEIKPIQHWIDIPTAYKLYLFHT